MRINDRCASYHKHTLPTSTLPRSMAQTAANTATYKSHSYLQVDQPPTTCHTAAFANHISVKLMTATSNQGTCLPVCTSSSKLPVICSFFVAHVL
jgi:hypothetical protein